MGCAVWKGVRLKDLLEHAGVKESAKMGRAQWLRKTGYGRNT